MIIISIICLANLRGFALTMPVDSSERDSTWWIALIRNDSTFHDSVDNLPLQIPDSCAAPAYPPLARSAGIWATVRVELLVDKEGRVKNYWIKKEEPSGLGFGEEVMKVVMKWCFQPATLQGIPCGTSTTIRFEFSPKTGARWLTK